MKTIIAGGRDYWLTNADFAWLRELKGCLPITEVVSGCALGADRCGEYFAKEHRLPVKKFPADWKLLGLQAGSVRNGQMAEYADALILFPGGRGTADMRRRATVRGIPIYERDKS